MKKILLIEDSQDIRETTKEILELADYEVLTADNGKTGVELVKSSKPDLIICDIMMPDLDGYGVYNILSRNINTSKIPFIFLTAKVEKGDIRKGMNLGADDYITKPFEESDLLDAVEVRLRKNEDVKNHYKNKIADFEEFIRETKGMDELKDISKSKKIRFYKKKEVLYREYDFANYLFQIIKGKVKCFKTDDYGKEYMNDIYYPGEFIGYITLLEGGDYQETAIAMEDSEVSVIPKYDFLNLIKVNRVVASKFIKLLSNNVLDREKRLLKLAYAPVRERVAEVLLKLMDKEDIKKGSIFKFKISRDDLASMVGTAKESLIRSLSELKKEGIIDTDGQEIIILNEKALYKQAENI